MHKERNEATQGQPGWRQHLHHRRADPGSFSLGLCFDQRSGRRAASDIRGRRCVLDDRWRPHIQFIDTSSNVQELAFLSDVTASNTSVAETTRAEAAEAALGTQITTETSRAEASELTLTGSITAEVTRAIGAESTLNTAISTETTRAARNKKHSRPTWLAATPSPPASRSWQLQPRAMLRSTFRLAWLPTTSAAGDVYLITGGDTHIQFIDTSSNVQELAFLSDVTASNTSVAETTRAEAAEATLTHSDHHRNQPSGRSELTLTGSITAEVTRATGAESTLQHRHLDRNTRAHGHEALKANLAGGNTFTTGEQILAPSTSGYASINVPAGVAAHDIRGRRCVLDHRCRPHIQFIDTPATCRNWLS